MSYERGTTVLGDLTYQYDAAGRPTGHGGSYARLVLPPAVTGTTYDAANRLLTRTTGSGTTTLTRDDNGNVTGDGTNTYTWNARNRLVGISGGTSASFGYDALGRRSARTVGTTTTEFLYSGRSILREQVGTTYATLLTSPGGERYTRTSGSVRRTLLTAPDGDTIALADDAGTVQTEYSYGPQCETTQSGASDSNPYKCLGMQDDGTGLHFDGDGYSSPSLGTDFGGSLGRGSRGGGDYTSRMRSAFDFSGDRAQLAGTRNERLPGGGSGGGGYLGGGTGALPGLAEVAELIRLAAIAAAAGATAQAEALYETIRDILMPNGQPIGQPGTSDGIREIPGGAQAAEELLEKLREHMTPSARPGYPGETFTTEDGGFVGHRPESRSGDPALDINDPTVPEIDKIHFPPESGGEGNDGGSE